MTGSRIFPLPHGATSSGLDADWSLLSVSPGSSLVPSVPGATSTFVALAAAISRCAIDVIAEALGGGIRGAGSSVAIAVCPNRGTGAISADALGATGLTNDGR